VATANKTTIQLNIPKWAIYLYGFMAVVLIPWILILAEYLPAKHLARNWDPLWVGFDVMELIAIVLSLYFMLRRKVWVIMSASALATLLIVDAWFDILTSKPGQETREALFSGVIEISLSLLTYRLVFHILHKTTPNKNIKVHPTNDKLLSVD
jgi:hypothetical protein